MIERGLTQKQAEELLKVHGKNIIEQNHAVNPWRIFFSQIKSPLIFILIFAAVLSFVLQEYSDAFFILVVVLINSLLGFYQEYKAENTLEQLKKSVSKHVDVIRSGHTESIDASLLVPGDIFIVEPGLRVPADSMLFEANEILLDEAVLTGESEPVSKNTKEGTREIFMGTLVVEGIGKAQVVQTGSKTKFGEIAKNLAHDKAPMTPIKLELLRLSRVITVFITILILFVLILGTVNGFEFKDMFLTSVALGVSTIPEGLIISLTITLALGMNRLLSRKALVKNLPAAETLGDVDVLCIDKTGTLTYGNMQVADYDFVEKESALEALAISNNEANFIDKSVLSFLVNIKDEKFITKIQNTRKKLFPFSSEKKYTGAFDGKTLYAVGAPEVIFSFCKGETKDWEKESLKKAKEGNRMLALSKKAVKGVTDRSEFAGMDFLGLLYIKDPVRESVADSIKEIEKAGIEVKVITGDLKETAANVLKTLGIDLSEKEMISGKELKEYIDSNKLASIVLRTKLFYRTTPDQKLAIVKALQEKGKTVGMMGDGVNDSPALKASEIGIVVDNATDVSKEVADIILLDSNFKTIESAVEEGRNIIRNLRKIIIFLISDSLTETVLILLALLFALPLPLTPVLLLWINIIEDGLPSLALAFEKTPREVLLTKPKSKRRSLLDGQVVSLIIATSLIKDVIFFYIYYQLINTGTEVAFARTVIFAAISFSSLLFLFSVKTLGSQLWKRNLFDNKMINICFASGVFLLLATIYLPPFNALLGTVPLSGKYLLDVVLMSILSIVIIEAAKFVLHKYFGK